MEYLTTKILYPMHPSMSLCSILRPVLVLHFIERWKIELELECPPSAFVALCTYTLDQRLKFALSKLEL